MESLYVFLILNDVWIYILSALGLFWFINEYVRSRRILRRAMFGLEWEKGTRLRNNALAFIIIFAAIIGLVFYVNSQVKPTLSEDLFKPPTPTPDIFSTPLSSPTPLGTAEIILPSPTPPIVPTITLASQPGEPPVAEPPVSEPTESPTPPGPTVTPFIGCTFDLNISEPGNGAFVAGAITFSGTADTEDFHHYRLEANGPETNGDWASLLGREVDQPVRDGFLGNVNLSQWANGPYLIKLTAVNTTQSEVGQCVIQITLNN
ncbi:MAG: hypothetical protein GY803_23390 [Chloroflexi bacterium]|nr:hypothetical protein [Chloroflexota bacterium]